MIDITIKDIDPYAGDDYLDLLQGILIVIEASGFTKRWWAYLLICEALDYTVFSEITGNKLDKFFEKVVVAMNELYEEIYKERKLETKQ